MKQNLYLFLNHESDFDYCYQNERKKLWQDFIVFIFLDATNIALMDVTLCSALFHTCMHATHTQTNTFFVFTRNFLWPNTHSHPHKHLAHVNTRLFLASFLPGVFDGLHLWPQVLHFFVRDVAELLLFSRRLQVEKWHQIYMAKREHSTYFQHSLLLIVRYMEDLLFHYSQLHITSLLGIHSYSRSCFSMNAVIFSSSCLQPKSFLSSAEYSSLQITEVVTEVWKWNPLFTTLICQLVMIWFYWITGTSLNEALCVSLHFGTHTDWSINEGVSWNENNVQIHDERRVCISKGWSSYFIRTSQFQLIRDIIYT